MQLLSYPHEAEWTPFQAHEFSENLVAPEIYTGTSGSVARNSDHYTTGAVGLKHQILILKLSYCKRSISIGTTVIQKMYFESIQNMRNFTKMRALN
jgi:hypothetical protein